MPIGPVSYHVLTRRRPWLTGQLPADARTAAAWIAAGWEPTADQIRAMGPARAAALGLEYVTVSAWPPWILAALVIAWMFWPRRRRS